MSTKKRWTVVADGNRPLTQITKRLREAGFDIDQVLDAIGCVTGAATDEVATRLRAVPGVAAVEPELGIDIGFPDAPTTW